jgi:RimJ/RimL family protein N-acetyltransferase
VKTRTKEPPIDRPRLETERLVLREWRADDVGAYARIVGDPEVMRHLGSGPAFRLKRAGARLVGWVSDVEARHGMRRLVDHWQRNGFGEWALEEKATGALIGQIGLTHHPDWVADEANVEIGWMLARAVWGRGFATEGGAVALRYAFETLGLPRVISIAVPGNRRSLGVMERLGLSFAGETVWKRRTFTWYAIDRAQWERVRRPA